MSRSRPPKIRASRSCRNHGGCPWCEGNRLHANRRREPADDVGQEPRSMFYDACEDDFDYDMPMTGGTLHVPMIEFVEVA